MNIRVRLLKNYIQILILNVLRCPPLLFLFNQGSAYYHRVTQQNHESVSVDILDQVMSRADTLEDFLRNEELQEVYYQALVKYFSSRKISRQFSRHAYETLLGQVKTLAENVPGFSERAWRRNAQPTSDRVNVRERSTGRSLNTLAWKLKRHDWISNLQRTASGVSNKDIRSILIKVRNRIRIFEDELSAKRQIHGPRKQEKIQRNTFYANLMKDRDLNRVAAYFVHRYIKHSQNKIFFELMDADLIVNYFVELRETPRFLIPTWSDAPIPNALLALIKSLIPSEEKLLSDHAVFQPSENQVIRSRKSEYHTFSVRPFHGIWTGIFGKDCLAGDPNYIHLITPARWAVSLLQGTLVEFVERNGRYQGFVRTTPIVHSEYGLLENLEVWVPMMSRPVMPLHAWHESSAQKTSFFEHWFDSWSRVKSREGKKIVVSQSRIIDNERVKNTIFSSHFFREGISIHPIQKVELLEEAFMKVVNTTLPPTLDAELYFKGEAAIDATLNDASSLRCLSATKTKVISSRLRSIEEKNV